MSKIAFSLILIELVAVAWIDIKVKKIFNYWMLFNLALSVLFHIVFPEFYPLTWEILIFPVIWIVVGFFLFLLGIMGAGDSKYLASLFLVVPVVEHMDFFGKIVLSTMVVGILMLIFNVVKNFQELKAFTVSIYWRGILEKIRSKFSYAPVILLAWILLGIEIWK